MSDRCKTLIESSRASRLLEHLGYSYVHLDSDEVTFAAGILAHLAGGHA